MAKAEITRIIIWDDTKEWYVSYSTGSKRNVKKITKAMQDFVERARYSCHSNRDFRECTIYRAKDIFAQHSREQRRAMKDKVSCKTDNFRCDGILEYWRYAELEKEAEQILNSVADCKSKEEGNRIMESDATKDFIERAYKYAIAYEH